MYCIIEQQTNNGVTAIVAPICSCPRMIQLYQQNSRWMENYKLIKTN